MCGETVDVPGSSVQQIIIGSDLDSCQVQMRVMELSQDVAVKWLATLRLISMEQMVSLIANFRLRHRIGVSPIR